MNAFSRDQNSPEEIISAMRAEDDEQREWIPTAEEVLAGERDRLVAELNENLTHLPERKSA